MDKKVNFIFDTETNGLANCSLLSISYIITIKEKIIDKQTKYYFPKERYNHYATDVNGLTQDIVTQHRKNCDYPIYFEDDHSWLVGVMEEFNVDNIVAHNISFDKKFLPIDIINQINNRKISTFCTMKNNSEFVGIRRGKGFKTPKLVEACRAYSIEFDESEAHSSYYDTLKTYELYIKTMARRGWR